MATLMATDRPTIGITSPVETVTSGPWIERGELEQHLPDRIGADPHRGEPGAFAEHEVELAAGSLAARAVGAPCATVHSFHHQGVRRLPEGLRACARAVGEDTIEAVEDPPHPFALGALSHPEEDEWSAVIGALVDAARHAVASRAG
jgi:putative glutamine amidotransferase